jgi:hypothetical protein
LLQKYTPRQKKNKKQKKKKNKKKKKKKKSTVLYKKPKLPMNIILETVTR